MILIPLKHENMEGRRWPIVTFALIGLNILVFLGTHWTMEEQAPKLAEVRLHLLLLAAEHPELKIPDDAQQFVGDFQKANPDAWKQAASPYRKLVDAADARYRMSEDTEKLQEEMDSLALQYHDLQAQSIHGRPDVRRGALGAHRRLYLWHAWGACHPAYGPGTQSQRCD